LIFTSSVAAFGLPGKGQLLDESSSFNIKPEQFPYGHSKHLAELAVGEAIQEGLNAVIVNPTITLGARDVNMVSGAIVAEAARGLVRFRLPGGGNFVGVDDVIQGHIAAAALGRTGENYVLAGENLTHREVGRIVFEVLDRREPRLYIPTWLLPPLALLIDAARYILGNRVPIDSNQVRIAGLFIYADGKKAREIFGLSTTPFRTVVERTYQWYTDNGYIAVK